MADWAIIAIIAIGCGSIVSIVKAVTDRKYNERKMEAALRQQEMESGVAPGTYTGKRARKDAERAYKTAARHDKYMRKHHRDLDDPPVFTSPDEVQTERDRLKNGIDNLQQRIDNIEVIMRSRNEASSKKPNDDQAN